MKSKNIIAFIASIFIAELAGIIGSLFTTPNIETWYRMLAKPALLPPAWVFGPVWTTLFLLMGIAAFFVWRERESKKIGPALGIYFFQLCLNVLWSILFFGLQNPAAALFEIVILWLAIILTIVWFSKISKLAAWLLIPYLLWVTFAIYLNFGIWKLN